MCGGSGQCQRNLPLCCLCQLHTHRHQHREEDVGAACPRVSERVPPRGGTIEGQRPAHRNGQIRIDGAGRRIGEDVGEASRELVRLLMQLASVRRAVGDLTAAESLLREAIDITDKRLTADDPDRSLAKLQLAALLPSVGRFREAISLNQQILEEASQRGVRADRLRADILLNLAVIHQNQGLTESAAEYAANSARVTESVFGKDSWQLASAHNVLSAISRDLGLPDQAKSNAETAFRLCLQHRRLQHSEVATAHQLLGSLAAKRGDAASAIAHWRSAAEVFHARGQAARVAGGA